MALMGHGIGHDINSHGISFFLGEFPEVPLIFSFPFPAITEIRIVTDHDNDLLLVVEDGPVMGFLGIWSFPGNSQVATSHGPANTWNLRFIIELINTVEDLMFFRQVNYFSIWKDPENFPLEIFPLAFTPEVIDHHKTTVEQVAAQHFYLFLAQGKVTRFHHVNERVIKEFLVR